MIQVFTLPGGAPPPPAPHQQRTARVIVVGAFAICPLAANRW